MSSLKQTSVRFANESQHVVRDRKTLMVKNEEEKDVNKVVDPAMMEEATLESQFCTFSLLFESHRNGKTITLFRSDYWMRQAKILDDRNVTMTETGILFNRYSKTEITMNEWLDFLSNLCELVGLNEDVVKDRLTKCGLPGQVPVHVPQYRDYFLTYKPKEKMIYE